MFFGFRFFVCVFFCFVFVFAFVSSMTPVPLCGRLFPFDLLRQANEDDASVAPVSVSRSPSRPQK
jgi:hypothetical protein